MPNEVDARDETKLVDDLLYVAQCENEEERRLDFLSLNEEYGDIAVAEKGSYVVWLLETLAKVRNVAACQHLTPEQRKLMGIDPNWILETITRAEVAQTHATRLRRLLRIRE